MRDESARTMFVNTLMRKLKQKQNGGDGGDEEVDKKKLIRQHRIQMCNCLQM